MRNLLIICLLIATTSLVNAQESFKKKYFVPTKLANDIYLKKDSIITYDGMTYKERDEVIKKYKNTDYVEVSSEETINGKSILVTRRIKVDDEFLKSIVTKRSIKVTEFGIRGFVKFEEDGK